MGFGLLALGLRQVGHPPKGLDDGEAVEQRRRLGDPVVVEEYQVRVEPHDLSQ